MLAVVLAVGLVGCGAMPSEVASGAAPASSAAVSSTAPASSAVEEAMALGRGTWSGSTFTNTNTGVTVTVPDTWLMASDDDLAQNCLSVDGATFTAWTEEDFAAQQIIPDAMAQDPATGNNFSVQYENLAVATGGTSVDANKYLEIAKAQLANTGIEYTYNDVTTTTLNGIEYAVLPLDGVYSGTAFKQYLACRRWNDYIVLITFTVMDGTDASTFYGMFA